MILKGAAHKYGKNVDTDVIIPGRYCNLIDPVELGKHALEDLDADFVKKVKPGDLIVADTNFGCGSSREVAAVALKGAGVSGVVAKSFARIFYRNAINTGLPIFECVEGVDGIKDGDSITVDAANGVITNESTGKAYSATQMPPFMQDLIAMGGLLRYVEKRLVEKSK
ncbi:MAG TPA: 3-isopropylmalate dehydratase small subunit [Candidatus Eremiobacteraceae bacterium]|nr:3-isopropylmalate dehydratase small subunit [Candidatus Eremiobacteraceae bacterium]